MHSTLVNGIELTQVQQKIAKLKQNLCSAIRGKQTEIEYLITSVIAGQSILIQDVPGVGKTTLAKALAASMDMRFHRIQCTPDLMPADVFGVSIFNPKTGEFHFRQGPVFTNLLLVDEINRASPRTQSALLEAMAEQQVTAEGKTYELNSPFIVIATQNPKGYRGTFPLPESQLDRFAIKISMDYPDAETELEILYQESQDPALGKLNAVVSLQEFSSIQRAAADVKFDRTLAEYLLAIVRKTREHTDIETGCSPRGAISFFNSVKAFALVKERSFVLPDDVQQLAPLVLGHRLALRRQSQQTAGRVTSEIVQDIIREIDVPV